MYYYHLFGRTFASEIEFPELTGAPANDVHWTLREMAVPPSPDPLPLMGTEEVSDGVTVALRGTSTRFRLTYDDTGSFDISDGGRTIVWHRPTDAPAELRNVRTDILGRVMAVALDAAGIPTLHGSGVALRGAGVLFLAPKRHGKSTTAAALVQAGGQLLGDDMLAVVLEDQPMVLPGVPAVNLWRDAASWLRPAAVPCEPTGKQRIDWQSLGSCADQPVPLGAVYLLAPADPEAGVRVRREQLPSVEAALALVGQAKIGALLGPGNAPRLLAQCATLSAAVPVYRLTVPRELGRLDDLVRCVGEWNETPLRTGGGAPVW